MSIGFRKAIFQNPKFIARRIWRGIRTGEVFWDMYYFFKMLKAPAISKQTNSANYFAQKHWPTYDFENEKITLSPYRPATNKVTEEHLVGAVL